MCKQMKAIDCAGMVQRKGGVSTFVPKQSRKTMQMMLDLSPKRRVVYLLDYYGQRDNMCKDSGRKTAWNFQGTTIERRTMRDMTAGTVRGPTEEELGTKNFGVLF